MPVYAFECSHCGHAFDRLQRLSDPDPSQCPECESTGVRRQLTAPSFRLSGSGWYETDFKKDSEKRRNLTETAVGGSESKQSDKAESTAAAKVEPKSDSKPDVKVDPKPPATPPAAS